MDVCYKETIGVQFNFVISFNLIAFNFLHQSYVIKSQLHFRIVLKHLQKSKALWCCIYLE